MASTGQLPPEIVRSLIQSCKAPDAFNFHSLSQLCTICCVSSEWRRHGQVQLETALARWGLCWDPHIWYGIPTLGWLGCVRENEHRSTDYAALDGGDDGLLSIRLTEKTNLKRADHRRYIAEKFCKHGSVEQILRLFSVLLQFDRLYPKSRRGFFCGDFFEHLEQLFIHASWQHDSIIVERRFPIVRWFLQNWDGFFSCFEGQDCTRWTKQHVLDECLGMVASTRNRRALRLWREAGAQMVKHRGEETHMWRSGSIGAWGEIFCSDSVSQEQLRLFEVCVTAGPRFVKAARASREVASAIIDSIYAARDAMQYERLARGIRRRRPFKHEAFDILPPDMLPTNASPEGADHGGEPALSSPLPLYSDEEDDIDAGSVGSHQDSVSCDEEEEEEEEVG